MKKLPKPKGPVSALKRSEMIRRRYDQMVESRENEELDRRKQEVLSRIKHEEMIGGGYAMTDEEMHPEVRKQINKRIDPKWNDVEPAWRSADPRRRISWHEFCRDFMGQNYGAIAQDLLEMHNSEDPAMKVQFMKFMMEMGKQGNPSSLQLDVNAQIKAQSDIYSQLQLMTMSSEPGIEDAQIIEPAMIGAPSEEQQNEKQNTDIM